MVLIMNQITFEDFGKVDIRVERIVEVEDSNTVFLYKFPI